MKINDAPIGARLNVGFAIVGLLFMVFALFTLSQMLMLSSLTTNLYEHPYEVRRAVRDLKITILTMENTVDEMIIAPDRESRQFLASQMDAYDADAFAQYTTLLDRFLGDTQPILDGRTKFAEWRLSRDEVVRRILAGDIKAALDLKNTDYRVKLGASDSDIQYILTFSLKRADNFYKDAIDAKNRAVGFTLSLLLLMALAGYATALIITLSIRNPVRRLMESVRTIAEGDLESEIEVKGRDEIARLATSMVGMRENLREKAALAKRISEGDFSAKLALRGTRDEVAASINRIADNFGAVTALARRVAEGDFSVTVEPRSEYDALGAALRAMTDTLKATAAQANRVASGDYQSLVEPRSDRDELGKALASMVASLRDISALNARTAWIRDGLNGLNEATRGDLSAADFAKEALHYIAKYTAAKVGVLYASGEDADGLDLTAAWAFTRSKGPPEHIRPGEGLAGQAILEGELMVLEKLPEDYLVLSSALGEAPPRSAALLPVTAFIAGGTRTVGLVELGFLVPPAEELLEFLRACTASLSAGLLSARSREGMSRLLEETRRQSSLLLEQQEELRATNEELESQTQALRQSEEELRVQQEELRVSNEELQERTEALEAQRYAMTRQNEELENARLAIQIKAKDFEAASRYKSEFLANMSHELRTPLNSILILSQLIAESDNGATAEKKLEYARTINSAGNDLLTLINDILDLSKIEAGKIELHPQKVEIALFSMEMAALFRPVAVKKGLDLSTELLDGCPQSLVTDPTRLHQIVKNILSNAVKFTEKGSVVLSIGRPTRGMAPPVALRETSNVLSFSVRDTGIGVAREKQDGIFEAFRQADMATSRKYGGTGLGLSISRELARILGGEITLESKPGAGSVFTLYLPEAWTETAAETEPGRGKRAKRGPEKAVAASRAQLPERIEMPAFIPDDRDAIAEHEEILLIIDDDADFARVLADRGHERGFKVIAAGDGESGLELAFERRPDAVILDIGLPGMDGWEVMERLKEDKRTSHIPIHFVSGRDEAMNALERGAIGYLTKPVSLEDLNASFERIMRAVSDREKRVLVVEDDPVQRLSIVTLVGGPGVETEEVESGAQALERMTPGKYDCIILDLGLKDMSGVELLQAFRSRVGSTTPIIVYTGRDVAPDEELELRRLSESIIIKGARSPERLVDEVTLFLHKVEAEMPLEQRRLLERSRATGLEGKKVLVVDDDMRNVFALTSVLETQGIRVVVGRNGREGLERLAENGDVGLVLMDVMMPEMDGYEAMTAIRRDPANRRLPIIALTAKAMKEDRERCIEAGANDYLAKPVDLDKLASLIRIWMR